MRVTRLGCSKPAFYHGAGRLAGTGSIAARPLATGHATIRSDAIAVRVLTDPMTGCATGVEYADRRTCARHVVRARAGVLCASPIESVRLLLNSRSALHPHGLGNNTGQLGRYFMDQCSVLMHGRWPARAVAGEAAPLPTHPFHGVTGGFYIPRYANIGNIANPSFQRGYSYQGSIGRRDGEDAEGMIDMCPFPISAARCTKTSARCCTGRSATASR
ncbi:hypothetical protein [Gluconacetobacter asukensis]|uniref:hypothetical protein n=1 Tax=Gluconacetobacter asukensis TaxID=1017181 RepID=UPI001FE44336|nr:hypothetical protein [Gluconacetobacter asukensis]